VPDRDVEINEALRAVAYDVRLKAAAVALPAMRLRPYEQLRHIQRIVALADEVDRLIEASSDRKSERRFEAILRELGRAGAFPECALVAAAAFAFEMG